MAPMQKGKRVLVVVERGEETVGVVVTTATTTERAAKLLTITRNRKGVAGMCI